MTRSNKDDKADKTIKTDADGWYPILYFLRTFEVQARKAGWCAEFRHRKKTKDCEAAFVWNDGLPPKQPLPDKKEKKGEHRG